MQTELATTQKLRIPYLVQFFGLTYLISWSIWGLVVFFPETMGEMYFLIIFGAFGPFAAAAILTRVELGKQGAVAWRKEVLRLRGRVRWLLLSGLGIPLAIALVHILVYALAYGLPAMQYDPPWYWLFAAIPVNVYVVFVYSSGFGEEPGWQGYAMPRLLQRFHPIIACAILGVLWALWHLPLQFTPLWEGNEPLGWMLLYTTPLAMIATWLTNKARRSAMPAVFLHQATNLYGSYLLGTEVFQAPLEAYFTPVKTGIYWAIAIILIISTRAKLGYEREQAASRQRL